MAGGGKACTFGDLSMGTKVRVSRLQDEGVVRYLGPIDGQEGDWVGVEMDRPQRALGKNDGTMGGIRLFQCEPRHGAFVRASAVLRLGGGAEESPASCSVAAPGGLLPPEPRAAAPAPAPAPQNGAAAAPQAAAPPAAAPPPAAASPPSGPAAPKAAGKGKGKGPPPPKGGGPAAARAEKEKAAAATGEGATVEVLSGPHAGKRGVVVKVTGEGKEARYRVTIEGDGPTTWVDSVQPAAGGNGAGGGGAPASPPAPASSPAPASAKPAAPPSPPGAAGGDAKPASPKGKGKGKGPPPVPTKAAAPPKPKKEPVAAEGAIVEVAAGPHAGKRATVMKVTGEGKDTRWRVQVDGGPATWVDAVNKAA